ncbi:MAG: hypothetical protein ACFFA4_16910 [Promethearchaeota archaeon]
MEIIKKNIKDNETIKWEKYRIINYRNKIFKSFFISVFLIGVLMTLLGLFFWYVPSWGGTFYLLWTDIVVHPLVIYLIILSIFISGAIAAIAYAIKLFKRGLRRVDLKLADLHSYHQIHILTNKQWIQKDYRSLIYFGANKLPNEAISITKDITCININNIERAIVSKIRSNYNISFHFKRIFDLNQNLTFNVKFKFEDYQELKNVLKEIIKLEILKK